MFVRTQGNVLPTLCGGLLYNFFTLALFFYWRCHFVQELFGIIFTQGAYDAPGGLFNLCVNCPKDDNESL